MFRERYDRIVMTISMMAMVGVPVGFSLKSVWWGLGTGLGVLVLSMVAELAFGGLSKAASRIRQGCRVRSLRKSIKLGAPIGPESFVFDFDKSTGIMFGAPAGKEPFAFLAALRAPQWGEFQASAVNVLRRPVAVNSVEVDVAVPHPNAPEEEAAKAARPEGKGSEPDRCVSVGILDREDNVLVSCELYSRGSAHASRKLDPDGTPVFAEAPTFPGGSWYTIRLERADEGCRISVSDPEGTHAECQRSIDWPPTVKIGFAVMSRGLQPMGWFTRPRLS